MRIGAGPGPSGSSQHQSIDYIYDKRTGVIVAIHHSAGTVRSEERLKAILRTSSEASGVSPDYLAVLTNPDVESEFGALRVDHATKKVVGTRRDSDPHVRP